MLLVQRFADLALSALRLGFVAQQCGVTEPGKKKKKTASEKTVNKATTKAMSATSVFCVVTE